MSDAGKLQNRAISKKTEKLQNRTQIISITKEEPEVEQEEQPYVPKTKYPVVYETNMRELKAIENFIGEHKFFSLENVKNERELWKYAGIFLSRFDFINIKKMVLIYNEICDDMININNGSITKTQVVKAAQKINQIKKLYQKYNI